MTIMESSLKIIGSFMTSLATNTNWKNTDKENRKIRQWTNEEDGRLSEDGN